MLKFTMEFMMKCSHNEINLIQHIWKIREEKYLLLVRMQTKRHFNCWKVNWYNFREQSTILPFYLFDTYMKLNQKFHKILPLLYEMLIPSFVFFLFYSILLCFFLSLFHFFKHTQPTKIISKSLISHAL